MDELVSLTFDAADLELPTLGDGLTRTFSTQLTPSSEVIEALTLIHRPTQDFSFNKNHPQVSPALLKQLQPTIQQRINLLNTRLTSKAKDCADRKSYDQMIEMHVQSIRALSNQMKKLVVAGLKDTMTRDDLELVRFAVSKRFAVWRTSLEVVRKRSGTWDRREELWKRLIQANRMSWSAYHLEISLRV